MSDLRAAVRAYAVLDDGSPARLVRHLDRLAETTGLGHRARLVYLTLDRATGEIRFTNAGGCPLLVVGDAVGGRFVDAARSTPVGQTTGDDRPEATLRLAAGSTLLMFTDGLVESRSVSRAVGVERLRRAAAAGPTSLDDLCDHVVKVCTRSLRRDDDICLLGVRLGPLGRVSEDRRLRARRTRRPAWAGRTPTIRRRSPPAVGAWSPPSAGSGRPRTRRSAGW